MAVVLVVEDEEQVRVLAQGIIQDMGHETLTAANVKEALALLSTRHAIDLLFADIGLWGAPQGGLELAKEAVRVRPDLPVLYTTGQGVTDGMRAMFVERFAFLGKPYTPDQLSRQIADIVGTDPP